MNIEPDILLLRKRDSDEWDIAFKWLWPTAYAVSRNVLSSKLPNQIEDNAIEAIEAVIEKVNESWKSPFNCEIRLSEED